MTTRNVVIVVKTIDQATTALKRVGGGLDDLGDKADKATGDIQPLGMALTAVGVAGAALISSTALTAARVEVLGTVLHTVGGNAGYSKIELNAFEASVKGMGITTSASRQALLQMIQAEIDVTHATDLARLAQDAAVIANVNSSVAFERMVTGIQQGRTIILRGMGLNVDFAGSYKRMADQLGISTSELSNSQKMQARLNEVMKVGKGIAGSYEAAMGNVGKQISSLPRYYEEAGLALGQAYLPMLGGLVDTQRELLKAFIDLEPEQQRAIGNFILAGTAITSVTGGLILIVPKIHATVTAIQALNTAALGMGVALGPLALATAGFTALYLVFDEVGERAEVIKDIPEDMDELAAASILLDGSIGTLDRTNQEAFETFNAIEIVTNDLADGWRSNYSPELQNARELTDSWTHSLGLSAEELEVVEQATHDYTQQLDQLTLSIKGPVGEANESYIEQQSRLNEKLIEARTRLEELDPTQNNYTQKVIDTKSEIYNLSQEMRELDTTHREVMANIVYDMMVARLATDGWTSAEAELALEFARSTGIIDQETWNAATSMNAAMDSFYTGTSVANTKAALIGLANDMAGLPIAASSAGQGMASGMQPGINALETGVHKADALDRAIGRIDRHISIGIYWEQYNAPSGPQEYQHGTNYVPQTGLALLHKGEAVIPASRNKGRQGGSSITIHNNFGTDSVRSDQDIDKITDAIQRQLELRGVRGRIG